MCSANTVCLDHGDIDVGVELPSEVSGGVVGAGEKGALATPADSTEGVADLLRAAKLGGALPKDLGKMTGAHGEFITLVVERELVGIPAVLDLLSRLHLAGASGQVLAEGRVRGVLEVALIDVALRERLELGVPNKRGSVVLGTELVVLGEDLILPGFAGGGRLLLNRGRGSDLFLAGAAFGFTGRRLGSRFGSRFRRRLGSRFRSRLGSRLRRRFGSGLRSRFGRRRGSRLPPPVVVPGVGGDGLVDDGSVVDLRSGLGNLGDDHGLVLDDEVTLVVGDGGSDDRAKDGSGGDCGGETHG